MPLKKDTAAIFGAGCFAEKVIDQLKQRFEISFAVDNNVEKQGTYFQGYPVLSPEALLEETNVTIIICIRFPAEVIGQLEKMNVPNPIYAIGPQYTTDIKLIKIQDFDYAMDDLFDYYYSNDHEYHVPLSQWKQPKLYFVAADIISKQPRKKMLPILEIGCGSGQFANLLFERGYINYTGIDISSKAIKLARNMNPNHMDKFLAGNIFDNIVMLDDYDLIISFEVLEHLKNDLELVKSIPCGKRFLFSVPDFWSFNHLRVFKSTDDIKDRYGALLKITSVQEIVYDKAVYFLVDSVMRNSHESFC